MAQTPPVFYATIVFAVLAAGTGWDGVASAQAPQSPDPRIEVQRAQRELTAAENVLRDARAARAKAGADAAEQAKARAAEAAAERNAEAAALALARARSGRPLAAPPAPPPAPAPAPATGVALEALIHARMDVESAETVLARAQAARAEIARKTNDEIHDLTRQLADAVALRKRAGDGPLAAEAATLEAGIKALIQDATGKLSEAEIRETEAVAALEAARAREARARAEIEARLPAR